jgi:hypothetical protein
MIVTMHPVNSNEQQQGLTQHEKSLLEEQQENSDLMVNTNTEWKE